MSASCCSQESCGNSLAASTTREITVVVWRCYRVTVSISKHAIACHLDVNDMLFTITKGFRNNPFSTFAIASQAL
ncbi:hypothetical protein TMatcc_010337 [Talaromyces marneffei ATCC 18224]